MLIFRSIYLKQLLKLVVTYFPSDTLCISGLPLNGSDCATLLIDSSNNVFLTGVDAVFGLGDLFGVIFAFFIPGIDVGLTTAFVGVDLIIGGAEFLPDIISADPTEQLSIS